MRICANMQLFANFDDDKNMDILKNFITQKLESLVIHRNESHGRAQYIADAEIAKCTSLLSSLGTASKKVTPQQPANTHGNTSVHEFSLSSSSGSSTPEPAPTLLDFLNKGNLEEYESKPGQQYIVFKSAAELKDALKALKANPELQNSYRVAGQENTIEIKNLIKKDITGNLTINSNEPIALHQKSSKDESNSNLMVATNSNTPWLNKSENLLLKSEGIKKALSESLGDTAWKVENIAQDSKTLKVSNGSNEFTVHPEKISTNSIDESIFKAMIVSFKAASPPDALPQIKTSPEATGTWIKVLSEMGYKNAESLVIDTTKKIDQNKKNEATPPVSEQDNNAKSPAKRF